MKLVVLSLLTTFLAIQLSKASPGYQKVNSRIALANEGMSTRLKDQLWPSATGVWEPKRDQVRKVLHFLETEKGKGEIISAAHSGIDMRLCVSNVTKTRFQVYGFIIKDRKCLLFDSAPDISTPQIGDPDRWLEKSVGQSVYDGGSAFWFVLLDLDSNKVMATGHRPD